VTGYFAETVRFGSLKLKATESVGRSPPDMFVAKYGPDGRVLWVRKAGGDHLDQGYGIATDKEGNVYVTGYFQDKAAFGGTELTGNTYADPGRDYDNDYGDMFIAKYTSEGNLAWVRRAGGQGKNAGNSVAVGPTGHVYVTGGFGGGTILFGDIKV